MCIHCACYSNFLFFRLLEQRPKKSCSLFTYPHLCSKQLTNEWLFDRSVGMWVFQLVAHSIRLLYAPLTRFMLYWLFVSMNNCVVLSDNCCCCYCYRWCILVFIPNWYILCKCVGWKNSLHMHFRLLVCYGWF